MSYILEALRRAEQERSRGQPAPVQIVNEHGQPVLRSTERPVWPWLALGFGLALGLGGLMLWWLRPAAAPAPGTEAATAAPAATPASAPAAAIAASEELSSLDDLVDDSAALEPPPLPEDTVLQPFDAAQPEPELSPEPDAAASEPEPAEAQTRHQSIQFDPPDAVALAARQRTLKDMPPEYRNDFPKLNVEVHAYDEDPAARFALINGRRFHEGEQLPEGPVVSEITPDGIVFSFRNADVLVPVGY